MGTGLQVMILDFPAVMSDGVTQVCICGCGEAEPCLLCLDNSALRDCFSRLRANFLSSSPNLRRDGANDKAL